MLVLLLLGFFGTPDIGPFERVIEKLDILKIFDLRRVFYLGFSLGGSWHLDLL